MTKAHRASAGAGPSLGGSGPVRPETTQWRRAGQDATGAMLDLADGGSVQRLLTDLQGAVGNEAVQRMVGKRSQPQATAQRLQERAGLGRPLEAKVQRRVGQALATDLSSVRVHDDDEADALARGLGAEAFTSGHDMYFTKGAYDPSSEKGLKTVAHEATHVVQQSRGPVEGAPIGGGLSVSDPGDRFEQEAETTAEAVAAGAGTRSRAAGPSRPPSGGAAPGSVQRACGCGGSCGPCGGGKKEGENEPEEQSPAPIQRLARPSSPLAIQRAPLPLEQMGDLQVMFNPSASISFTAPGKDTAEKQDKNPASDTITFDEIPRGSTGRLDLDVAMQWFGKAAPGPVPGNCDVCEVLHQALIINIFGITKLDLVPAALLAKCRELVKVDPNGVLDILLDIQSALLDPCGKLLDVLNVPAFLRIPLSTLGCSVALAIPGVAQSLAALQKAVSLAVDTVRKAIKNLPPECKNGGKKDAPPTATGELRGGGRSILRSSFQVGPDGRLVFSGLPPQASRFGRSAELTIPVDFVRDGSKTGGFTAQQPLIKTVGEANAAAISKAFTAEIKNQKAPADAAYLCTGSFGPFKVASETFVQDDKKIQELRTYYFGMHPKIRQNLEEGKGQMQITGRASTTGSQAKNLGFAERRALRVRKILQGFAGQNAKFNFFSLGELGAQAPGELDGERRADVEARGTVLEGGVLDAPCTGHEGEPTPTGATQPVTEGEDVTGVPAGTGDVESTVAAGAQEQQDAGASGAFQPLSFEQGSSPAPPVEDFQDLKAKVEQETKDLLGDSAPATDAQPASGGFSDLFESAFA